MQTIASVRLRPVVSLPTEQHVVPLGDGDAVVIHDDRPTDWRPGDASILLIHGLCGCHAAPYMVRFADQFFGRGVRVFRLDMRGCGAGSAMATQLTHAGRSDDVLAALGSIAQRTERGPLGAIGVSLGGNQLLRAVGRVGAGIGPRPDWFGRLARVAAVSPPVDLPRCSANMERWLLRPYNYYFIHLLLSRAGERVRRRDDYRQALSKSKPRTLWQLDDRLTAPLSGYRDAGDYYRQCSAMRVTEAIDVPCLVVAAEDDPVVPIDCFTGPEARWSEAVRLLVSPSGGHVGFIDRQRQCWLDRVLAEWFEPMSQRVDQTGAGSISSLTGEP